MSIGEVVRNLEARIALVECFDEATNTCPITSVCRLAPVLERATGAFLRELDQVRLRELVTCPADLEGALRDRSPSARAPDTRRGPRS
ncbi:MAG: hypothetical protein IPK07_12160 [Deltaproteobacteria bacterium]|nr:hypothetical protein [Deltaproteobacteria bacterium]